MLHSCCCCGSSRGTFSLIPLSFILVIKVLKISKAFDLVFIYPIAIEAVDASACVDRSVEFLLLQAVTTDISSSSRSIESVLLSIDRPLVLVLLDMIDIVVITGITLVSK